MSKLTHCYLLYILCVIFNSCSSSYKITSYFNKEYKNAQKKCMKVDSFNIVKNVKNECHTINKNILEFSAFSKKVSDSLKKEKSNDFFIFHISKNYNLQNCSIVYCPENKSENLRIKMSSLNCETDEIELKKRIHEWNNLKNNIESKFSYENKGKNNLYYIIKSKNGVLLIEKFY